MRPRDDHALVPSRSAHAGDASTALALVDNGRLVPARDPDARTADGYLRLTAHLLLEAERHGFRTVGVFSALTGEGKTTAALNLAASLGRTRGREGRVLLEHTMNWRPRTGSEAEAEAWATKVREAALHTAAQAERRAAGIG